MRKYQSSKYLLTYNNLILQAKFKNRKKSKTTYYESHHIIPQSCNGTNDKWNLVLLTAREHFMAHYLLFKHYKSINYTDYYFKMVHAFNYVSATRTVNSHSYKIAKEERRRVLIIEKTGTKHSEATKNKIKKSLEKVVIQYNPNGEEIHRYSSLCEAAKKTLINRGNIGGCCNGLRKTAGGFIFKYKE